MRSIERGWLESLLRGAEPVIARETRSTSKQLGVTLAIGAEGAGQGSPVLMSSGEVSRKTQASQARARNHNWLRKGAEGAKG